MAAKPIFLCQLQIESKYLVTQMIFSGAAPSQGTPLNAFLPLQMLDVNIGLLPQWMRSLIKAF